MRFLFEDRTQIRVAEINHKGQVLYFEIGIGIIDEDEIFYFFDIVGGFRAGCGIFGLAFARYVRPSVRKRKANIFSLEVVTPVLLEKNELANALTLSGDSQR